MDLAFNNIQRLISHETQTNKQNQFYLHTMVPWTALIINVLRHTVMFWPSTRPQKMLFQGDAPEGRDTFRCQIIERDRVGGLRLIIWNKLKVPLCQYRLMQRKRVTSELYDSYFRLMTIKHSISKIQWAIAWALNYYLTQLSSSPRSSCQSNSRQLETRCGRESHTRPSGPSETPMEFGVQRRC